MKTFLVSLPFLLVVVLIIYAQGSLSGFTVWNCLPVAAAFGVLRIGLRLRGRPLSAACITFSVVAALLPALFHLALLFDWGGTSTGSSTSALAFIFVPLWTGVFAAVAGAVAWGIALCFRRLSISKAK